jgi:F0F1-type ATP synthase assembly protein I
LNGDQRRTDPLEGRKAPDGGRRSSQSNADMLRTIGALSTVGLSFVLAIALGTAFGYWIDTKFGTKPWGFFVFFFLGLAAGVLNVYRITKQHIK